MRHYPCRVEFLERAFHPLHTHGEVLGVNFDADAVAAPKARRGAGCAGAAEGIQDGIPDEAEHADETFSELEREGGRMLARRCARQTGPDLLEPDFMFSGRDDTQHPGGYRRAAIAARLAL